MKIAVLGTGMVGQTIAENLSTAGNEVIMGTRDPSKTVSRTEPGSFGRPSFNDWKKANPNVQVKSYAEAAQQGELIVNATNGTATMQALEESGADNLNGKVILDIANPLDFSKGMPPTLTVCNTDSLGEQVQRKFPGAKVVKGLNTLTAPLMLNPGMLKEEGHHLFIAGNDEDAKQKVTELLKNFGWKEEQIIDLGDITNARGTEQLLPIWIRLMGKLGTPFFNFKIAK
jgi:8-hydroxy-5-deazaflavin:NADPH oxidoreductase